MGIYDVNDTGTQKFTSRFTKSISNRMRFDATFHDLIPVLKRFCLPGDVWRIGGNALIRFLPMVSPSMTPYDCLVRYFFVPLRLIEENAELIITGSTNGKLYSGTLPVFDNFVKNANKIVRADAYKVRKHTFWDYMGVPVGDYESIKDNECLPANYWSKGYKRIVFDFYDDENYGNIHRNYTDFDSYWNDLKLYGADITLGKSGLKKDYFTSALPWQLKGVAPTLDVTGSATFTPNYTGNLFDNSTGSSSMDNPVNYRAMYVSGDNPYYVNENFNVDNDNDKTDLANITVKNFLNQAQNNISIVGLGFNADEFRVMMQQTKIFERLARCGSRYTEYLYSNFGTAPADETLQRPKYLGGWKIPIVTSEVLQTAEDGTTPVGTMRGHGISRGGNKIKDFYCKEFGLLFGLLEVRPRVEYTQGIPRQFTYKERFDFFNPSFQHLSEQEVRNGELYISFTDGLNDETLGFQAYANELRSYQDEVVADMRDTLSYWGSSLHFSSRPNVIGLLDSANHLASFNAPFVANSSSAYNILVDFYNILDVYRPMVRYSTPGLVDHF